MQVTSDGTGAKAQGMSSRLGSQDEVRSFAPVEHGYSSDLDAAEVLRLGKLLAREHHYWLAGDPEVVWAQLDPEMRELHLRLATCAMQAIKAADR